MAAFAVPYLLGPSPARSVASVAAVAPRTAEPASAARRRNVRDALARVVALEREWAVEHLIALTQIPAPPFGEGPRAQEFARRLRAIGGSTVTIDAVGNVIARRKGRGGGATVMLAAHLDTVFPAGTDVTVKRAGATFTAPGIGDNSRGLVVLLMLAQLLETHRIEHRGDIMLVGTVGEEGEGNLRGMRHLFARPDHGIDAAVVIDGGTIERLVTQAVGSHRYRVTFTGPGGHSYGAFGTANPHHAAANAIARFTRAAALVARSGTKTTFSVAEIGGGGGVNVIPTTSSFTIDMRSADRTRLDALDALLRASVDEAVAAENKARTIGVPLVVAFSDLGKRPAGVNLPSSGLVQQARAAMASLGLDVQLDASSTDANLPMSLGIPAVTISRGGQNLRSHSSDEQWIAEKPELGPQLTLLLVLAASEGAPR